MYSHVHTVLSEEQHGFIPRRSCETNLSSLVCAGWQAISSGAQLDCIYIRISLSPSRVLTTVSCCTNWNNHTVFRAQHSFDSLAARRTQYDLTFLARLFKHQLDSTSLRSKFGLAVPARSVRHRDLFEIPFARVETVKNGLFCRIPRLMNAFLPENDHIDIFGDSFYTFKSQCRVQVTAGVMRPIRCELHICL